MKKKQKAANGATDNVTGQLPSVEKLSEKATSA